jgi:hypothetical protein
MNIFPRRDLRSTLSRKEKISRWGENTASQGGGDFFIEFCLKVPRLLLN